MLFGAVNIWASDSPPTASIVPSEFPVYEKVSFEVRVHPGRKLAAGSKIEVQLPNSFNADRISPSFTKEWQTGDANKAHYIHVASPGAGNAQFKTKVLAREFMGGYAVTTRHGKCLVAEIVSGEVPAAGPIIIRYQNTTSPWIANQQPGPHEGVVYVAIDGQQVQPPPTFRVRPGPAAYQRVIVPSASQPNKPFHVLLVSLDKYSNLSSSHFDNVSIRAGNRVLAKGISYTGRIEMPLSLPKEGEYRLTANGVRSNLIRITRTPAGPYWGDIHFHDFPSVDAMGNIPYEYARNVSGLDFAGEAEHGAVGIDPHWRQVQEWCTRWNEPGRFVTLLAMETAVEKLRFHHNVYLEDDHAPIIEALKNGNSWVPLSMLVDYARQHHAITQLHHTGWGFDMRLRYPDSCRLIEVYSMHGSSELYDPADPLSFENQRHRKNSKKGPYYVRDAWALGQRFVTVGSSDNHFGQPGVRYNSVSGLYAAELTRPAILASLKKGLCYATTGERIVLDFEVSGKPMGSEIHAAKGEQLVFKVRVRGTGDLAEVKVFGCPFIEGDNSVAVGESRFREGDAAVDKARDSWAVAFQAEKFSGPDFNGTWKAAYDGRRRVYYVRVQQKQPIVLPTTLEGFPTVQARPVRAWSSPIWIVPR